VNQPKAVMAAPDFIYNSHWSIKDDGTILIPPTTDWMCGDLCQRAWSIVKGLTAITNTAAIQSLLSTSRGWSITFLTTA